MEIPPKGKRVTYQLMGREEYSLIQDRKCTTVMDRYKGEMQLNSENPIQLGRKQTPNAENTLGF